MQKNEKKSKSCLWIVLAVLNVVGIGFPLNYYLHTDEGTRMILLAAERPSLPNARMELVRFTKFANF